MFVSTSTYQKNASFFLGSHQGSLKTAPKNLLDAYRFGFNGQEKDNELKGKGNVNTAEFWEYDTRFGRRWNIDPVVKPWESSYATFGDNPISMTDVNGDDWFKNNKTGKVIYNDSETKGKKVTFKEYKDQVFTNVGSTKDLSQDTKDKINNGSIENDFKLVSNITELHYHQEIQNTKDETIQVLGDYDRPFDHAQGIYLPKVVETVDEDGVPLKVKVNFGGGFDSDNFHSPNNKVNPTTAEGFKEALIKANADGACVEEIWVNCTTNGHHDNKTGKSPNWYYSKSTHYVMKGGARAIDIGKFRLASNKAILKINNASDVVKNIQESFKKVSSIYEVYGPHINFKNGKNVGDQKHKSWIHISFE